jgi:hypothetical protein
MSPKRREKREPATPPATATDPVAPSQAPETVPEPLSAVDTAPPESISLGRLHVAFLFATLGLLLVATTPSHRFPAVFEAGRIAAIAAILLALGLRLFDHLKTPAHPLTPRLGLLPLAFATLGLAGLVGRHTHDFRLFADLHPALFGLPSELTFLLVAAGLTLRAHRLSRLATALLALGLLSGLYVLCLPDASLGETRIPLLKAFSSPTSATVAIILLCSLTVATLVLAQRKIHPRLLELLPFAIPIALAIPAATSSNPLLGLTFAALAMSIIILARPPLSRLASTPPSPLERRTLEYGLLAAILGLWLLLKSQALIASNTDENIYFYMAKRLADGDLPYRDYFFAHPPLHVLLPGSIFAVFGFSLTLAKLFPLLACLVGGLAVWGIARRALTPFAAPLALILYLFATEVLKASSNMTGVNMTTMFLLLGTWLFFRGRPLASGATLGLAPATGFYAIGPALALIAIGVFRAPEPAPGKGLLGPLRKTRFAQLLSFVIVLGLINAIFWALGGDRFLEGVYAYHQQKHFMEPDMVELFGASPGFPASLFHNLGVMLDSEAFRKEVFYHAHLWLAVLLLPLVVLGATLAPPERRVAHLFSPFRLHTSGPDGKALIVWLIALALFIQYAMFRELYSFYFALIYPFLALCLAWVIVGAVRLLMQPPSRLAFAGSLLGLLAIAGVGLHAAVARWELPVFEDETTSLGARNDYVWTEPPVAASLSPVVRNLFWSDTRMKGDIEPGYTHYLWTKKRGFSRLDDIAEHIRQRSAPRETLAGASTLAPLVALLADRRIAADEIDTNNKRFKTGLLLERDYWNRICQDGLRFVVSAPRSYFTRDKLDSLPTVQRYFGTPVLFEDETLSFKQPYPIHLYERISNEPCAWVE